MIGDRIRQARLLASFTLTEAVERLAQLGQPMSKQRLSNYERNKRTPSASLLIVLAKALGVRPAYFLEPSSIALTWVRYRCQARLGERTKQEIQAFGCSVAERHMYLQATLFPNQKPQLPKRRTVNTSEQAEASAGQLRDCWQLGRAPIESLTRAMENNGGIVVGYAARGVRFDGLSGWVNGAFPLVIVNRSVPDDRRRLSLGHELGHLLMDCSNVTGREEEALAYRFAAAFLVPADAVFKELGRTRRTISLNELVALKRSWGMSMQAWLRRMLDLDVIGESVYARVNVEFRKRAWHTEEPVDFTGHEEPTRLAQMTRRALAERIITEEKADELCPEATEGVAETEEPSLSVFALASRLMKLPPVQRREILAGAAALVEADYRRDLDLTGFEALGEDDLHE